MRDASTLPHTDIAANGWTARLPPAWRAYAILARLDRPIGIWLLFLPGLWGILLARAPLGRSVWLIALFALGSVAMRAAGCVVNDLWDRDLDRKVARTASRPLAAGTIAPRQALLFLAGLLMAGLIVLLQLPPLCWGLGMFSLLLVAAYPLAKRITSWPQAVLGCTFGFGAPIGYAAAAGHMGRVFWLGYGAAILWDLGFDTIYAHQDRADDAIAGIRSTARLLGEQTRPFLAACYAAMLAILAGAGAQAGLAPIFYPALILPAALLAWQVVRLRIDDPASCLALFRLNRETGLAVALAIALGAWAAG